MAAKSTENTENKAAETEAKEVVTVDQLGANFDYDKAKRLFGAGNALKAMHAVRTAGDYGDFSDAEMKHDLFGGFAIPREEKADTDELKNHYSAIRSKINTALKNLK